VDEENIHLKNKTEIKSELSRSWTFPGERVRRKERELFTFFCRRGEDSTDENERRKNRKQNS